MKKIDLGQSISILANIGVLAGLLLVAVQINQNTDIAGAQTLNDYYLADMQLELAMMGDSPEDSFVRAVYSPGELTERDAVVLDRYFNYGLVQIRRLLQMQELGLAVEDDLVDQINYLQWHLGNEVGRRWWAEYRADEANREIVQLIDPTLEASGFDQNRSFLNTLLPSGGAND